MNCKRYTVSALVLLLSVSSLPAQVRESKRAVAQPAKKNTGEAPTLMVYALRFAKASTVSDVLQQFLSGVPSVRLSVDERTNRVILMGTAADHKRVEALLKMLDTPQEDRSNVSVYALRYLAADENLAAILELACNKMGTFAFDRRTNSVIIQADKAQHEIVSALLERLDTQARGDKPKDQKWQIRVVWLVAGEGADNGRPIPEDLAKVAKELKRIGISNPRMTAQVLVSSSPGSEFSTQGRALLNDPCELLVAGMLQSPSSDKGAATGKAPRLQISIEAHKSLTSIKAPTGRQAPRRHNIASIETSIAAPIGHSVVLGVTPFEKMTSIFVVQLLPTSDN